MDVVRQLLDAGAYPNFMEINGNKSTPLDYALINNHIDIARLISERGGLGILDIRELAASSIQQKFRAYLQRRGDTPQGATRPKKRVVVRDTNISSASAAERSAERQADNFQAYRDRKSFQQIRNDVAKQDIAATRIQSVWRVSGRGSTAERGGMMPYCALGARPRRSRVPLSLSANAANVLFTMPPTMPRQGFRVRKTLSLSKASAAELARREKELAEQRERAAQERESQLRAQAYVTRQWR